MANTNNLLFPFDPAAFEAAVNKMIAALDRFGAHASDSTEGAALSESKIGRMVALWTVAFQKIAELGGRAFRAILDNVPEIGTTFKMAGDIMWRNLLWPLRQALIPWLQKILDWTRDNRATFVKWGQVIANVFRAAITIAKEFWELLKTLGKTFNDAIGGVFSNFGNNLERAMNILVFKIAAVGIFLGEALKPIAEWFGTILGLIGKLSMAFGGEFLRGFKETFKLDENIKNFKDMFVQLREALQGLGLDMPILIAAFKDLGRILGGSVGLSLKAILDTALVIPKTLLNIIDLAAEVNKWRQGGEFDWKKVNVVRAMINENPLLTYGKGAFKFGEEMIYGDEKGSYLQAALKERQIQKAQLAAEKKVEVNIHHNATLKVTEGDAHQAGKNFAKGTEQKVRDALLDNLALEGAGVP